MLYKSAMTASASGSVGGLTASRNRGGQYFRRRAIPVNTQTLRQQQVRQSLSTLAQQWSGKLTEVQRAGWNLYGKNVPIINALGDAKQQTGISAFIRSNQPIMLLDNPPVLDAPTLFQLGETPMISVVNSGTGATQKLSVGLLNQGDYGPQDSILVFVGRPQNQGISYFSGPYRYQGNFVPIAGGMDTLYHSLVYPAVAGQQVFVRVTASMADARYSTPSFGRLIVPTGVTAAAAPAADVVAPAGRAATRTPRERAKPTPAE